MNWRDLHKDQHPNEQPTPDKERAILEVIEERCGETLGKHEIVRAAREKLRSEGKSDKESHYAHANWIGDFLATRPEVKARTVTKRWIPAPDGEHQVLSYVAWDEDYDSHEQGD